MSAPQGCPAGLPITPCMGLRECKGLPNPQMVTPKGHKALSLPTPNQFCVYEKRGVALGVLTQLQGPTPQPVGYLSKETDNVVKGWPGCLSGSLPLDPQGPNIYSWMTLNHIYSSYARRAPNSQRRNMVIR
jgi:hypothetical protein